MIHYGTNNSYLTINGIVIENFGNTDPPYTISDLEDRAVIQGGVGQTGVRLDNARRPKQLVVNLMPGSDEARQLLALEKTGADLNATHRVGGAGERVEMFEGVIQRRGDMGRAGKSSVTDEQFTIVFLNSEET